MDRQNFDLQLECKQLMNRFRSLILATSAVDGSPDASTVPYLLSEGSFLILVSELAKHTAHLLETGRCMVLFLEDERETANIFARKRLTIEYCVSRVDRDEPESEQNLDRMAAAFGPVIAMLRQLPDFHLLQLKPLRCNYVRGFGQAFRFEPQDHPSIWQDSAAVGRGESA